jgi:hypothetical protein
MRENLGALGQFRPVAAIRELKRTSDAAIFNPTNGSYET